MYGSFIDVSPFFLQCLRAFAYNGSAVAVRSREDLVLRGYLEGRGILNVVFLGFRVGGFRCLGL